MTFKELLAIEHPDKIRPGDGSGCVGCPKDYGYEKVYWCDISHPFISCEICWNRIELLEGVDEYDSSSFNH